MIQKDQIQSLRKDWEFLEQHLAEFTIKFYGKLFQIRPDLKVHFGDGSYRQTMLLSRSFGVVIEGLDDKHRTKKQLDRIAAIHHRFEVNVEQFAGFEEALHFSIDALMAENGLTYSDEQRQAWVLMFEMAAPFVLY